MQALHAAVQLGTVQGVCVFMVLLVMKGVFAQGIEKFQHRRGVSLLLTPFMHSCTLHMEMLCVYTASQSHNYEALGDSLPCSENLLLTPA
jgi:hypothetical protein